ncbi:MAG: tRNA (N(6)-L-threonylcarbamoyladenosine(37)-C(2))-methylthiotransferase [Fibrobacteraceae bacterium]|nr:tRNA (N(6)-L-threonylcarbamoyladenosine(37)-C(2))-methylthiotransferase [Fibrobacteraceae bacterium]
MYSPNTVAILSEGCAANFGDGEEIGERFAAKGFSVCFEMPSETPAAIVLNACTVKGIASAVKLAKDIRKTFEHVPVWVTGCATEDLKKEFSRLFPDFCFSPYDAHKNPKALDVFLSLAGLSPEQNSSSTITLESQPGIGIVNIEEGCLDSCTYCSTHLVKKHLVSNTQESIIHRIQQKVDAGAKEIFLTGQDTSCYGFDIHTDLPTLLQKIISKIKGDYKIRLGMGNPRHILRYLDALLETYQDPHLYKFIHIPVQSGSDRILKAMNRRHTQSDYIKIASTFKQHFPNLTLGTDIIVAFPGETEEDFEESLNLIRTTRPSICNITRFVPREGTPAYSYASNLSKEERYARSAKIAEIFQKIALENNREFIGKEEGVIAEKKGFRKGTTIARDDYYRPVALDGEYAPGTLLKVRIKAAEVFALIGECIY